MFGITRVFGITEDWRGGGLVQHRGRAKGVAGGKGEMRPKTGRGREGEKRRAGLTSHLE